MSTQSEGSSGIVDGYKTLPLLRTVSREGKFSEEVHKRLPVQLKADRPEDPGAAFRIERKKPRPCVSDLTYWEREAKGSHQDLHEQ